jgi:hypothetical protein
MREKYSCSVRIGATKKSAARIAADGHGWLEQKKSALIGAFRRGGS